jgi:DNA uptake protein ComE-like DNA-binding protein
MSSAKRTRVRMAKVDLNTATKEDLMKLKGMTDVDADKIIAARPFTSVSELKSKNVIDAAEYGKIHGWVMVKKAGAAKK